MKNKKWGLILAITLIGVLVLAISAFAQPDYATKSGQPCNYCHETDAKAAYAEQGYPEGNPWTYEAPAEEPPAEEPPAEEPPAEEPPAEEPPTAEEPGDGEGTASGDVTIVVDGVNLGDVTAWVDGDVAVGPLRAVLEAAGAEVKWDAETKTIYVTTAGEAAVGADDEELPGNLPVGGDLLGGLPVVGGLLGGDLLGGLPLVGGLLGGDLLGGGGLPLVGDLLGDGGLSVVGGLLGGVTSLLPVGGSLL